MLSLAKPLTWAREERGHAAQHTHPIADASSCEGNKNVCFLCKSLNTDNCCDFLHCPTNIGSHTFPYENTVD